MIIFNMVYDWMTVVLENGHWLAMSVVNSMLLNDTICHHKTIKIVFSGSGAHPTNDISIEFENQSKLEVLWFEMCPTNHN